VRISGARVVDVSSGVESQPGQKNPEKVAAFLGEAARL
jgi:phosphoribosylanthranilate isomerase